MRPNGSNRESPTRMHMQLCTRLDSGTSPSVPPKDEMVKRHFHPSPYLLRRISAAACIWVATVGRLRVLTKAESNCHLIYPVSLYPCSPRQSHELTPAYCTCQAIPSDMYGALSSSETTQDFTYAYNIPPQSVSADVRRRPVRRSPICCPIVSSGHSLKSRSGLSLR